jgi:hypothetical protein
VICSREPASLGAIAGGRAAGYPLAVVAHSSDTVITDTPDGSERQPAIWPWLVMPAVVLLMFFTLEQVEKRAHGTSLATQSHTTGDAGDSSGAGSGAAGQ